MLDPFLRSKPHSKSFAQMCTTITLLDERELQKHLNACLRKVVSRALERFLNLRCPAVTDLLRFDFSLNSVRKELRVSCDHYVVALVGSCLNIRSF